MEGQYYQGYFYTNLEGRYQVYEMEEMPMIFDAKNLDEMKKKINDLIEDNAKKIRAGGEF